MIEHNKLFYLNVKDAIRYSISDKFAILAMGVFFTFLAVVEEATTSNTILAIIYLVVLVALLLFESGYSSKITEETIHGSTEPPRIISLRCVDAVFLKLV